MNATPHAPGPQTLAELATLAVEGAGFVAGPGGLAVLEVATEQCTAQVAVQGAQVCRWAPTGQRPVLFVSPKSAFADGKGIRGGVPVCFPWFANRTDDPQPGGRASPNHGFVRTRAWHVDDLSLEDNGRVRVTLSTRDDEVTRALWDHAFEATLVATIGQTLAVTLEVKNTGTSELSFEAALHSYFEVGDVERARLIGLEAGPYIDKVDGRKQKDFGGEALTIAGELDSVFQGSKAPLVIDDPVLSRHIRVEKTGSRTTVVWNPGLALGQSMADIGGEAWRSFLCVEAANALPHSVTLPPGATHAMSQRITVTPQTTR